MSTTLKLSGIRTYMSALLYNINLQKGDVIRVSDDVAGKIGGLHRMSDNDGIKVFFFESVPESTPLTYDFTNPTVLAAAINRAVDSDFMRRVAADATKEPEAPAPQQTPAKEETVRETAAEPVQSSANPEPEAPAPAPAAAPAAAPAESAAPVAPVAARKRASQRAATK